MKTKSWVLTAAIAMAALPTLVAAGTIDLAIDRAGGGGADIVVNSLDWNIGNGLAIGAVPMIVGANVEVRLQQRLSIFNLSTGGSAQLPAGREWTLVAKIPETVLSVAGVAPFQTVIFGLNPNPATTPNTIRIYEGNADANDLAGTGFDTGTLILEATTVYQVATFTGTGGGSGTNLDQFPGANPPTDDYPSIDTVTSIGVAELRAIVNFANPNYFTNFPNGPGQVCLSVFNTSQITPFGEAEPAASFLGRAPQVGAVNGINGLDFQFQVDANQSFIIAPPGDADYNTRVDASDFNILVLNWQGSGKTWAQGDFNGDSVVDALDFNALVLNWQSGVGAAADASPRPVPEPASLALLAIGGLALMNRSRSSIWTPSK